MLYGWDNVRPSWVTQASWVDRGYPGDPDKIVASKIRMAVHSLITTVGHRTHWSQPKFEGVIVTADDPTSAVWLAMRKQAEFTYDAASRGAERDGEKVSKYHLTTLKNWHSQPTNMARVEGEIVVVELPKDILPWTLESDTFPIVLIARPENLNSSRRPPSELFGINEEIFSDAADLYDEELEHLATTCAFSHPDQWRAKYAQMSDEEICEVFPEAQKLFKADAAGTLWAESNPKMRRNPYRSAVISMPTSAQLLGNPGKKDPYDPWEESLRAQRQAVYESSIKRVLGLKSTAPFRYNGQRLDTIVLERQGLEALRELIRVAMFAKGTRALQYADRQAEGRPTGTALAASYARYQDPVHLLENRQDYEETLGIARQGGFYRVTQEPTAAGMKYFVWPLPPKIQTPQPMSWAQAERLADDLNRTQSPLDTDRWWKPGRPTPRSLAAWLPPASFWMA